MKKNIHIPIWCLLAFLFCWVNVYAQSGAYNPVKRPHDWWQADWEKDSLPGISLDEAYNYLKGRKSKPVVVAILDDCVDTAHEELKDYIWTNTKEIPGNGIDDDHNGYIDDMHGWCFVANKNNVSQTDESTGEVLTYITWRQQFENIDTSKLKGSLKIQYAMYQQSKKRVFEVYRFYQLGRIMQSDTSRFIRYLDNLLGKYRDTIISKIPFATLLYNNTYDSAANIFWPVFFREKLNPPGPTLEICASIIKAPGYLNGTFFGKDVGLDNNEYDTTKNYRAVIGDDDNDFFTKYGTPTINIQGHSNHHATHIAGIIAANRQNNIGIKGVAGNVLIMPIIIGKKKGGVRDKDMVFAIHYAVDNGASIINMSIGGVPAIGEHVKEIMEALDYASQHRVLIVNAAGNDGVNMDNEIYNLGQGTGGKEHDDYIRIGATTTLLNDSLVSSFSNFGEKSVDLFAPGTAIYSTAPANQYDIENGTSFSAPIVVGVAALLKSYFPTLTAKEIKEILMKSVYKPDIMVIPPYHAGFTNKIPFSKMSKNGGIVNAYNAVKLADEMMKKSK